jgi:hypothetical protein
MKEDGTSDSSADRVQTHLQLVDIADWFLDEEFAIFPQGSKPKRAAFCPSPAPFPFLIAGHRYLFKVSIGWRIFQHWSEVIAFAMAERCDIRAAPCFVATDSRVREVGVLVEFFYGHPGSSVVSRFSSGADQLRRVFPDYESDPDIYHTVDNILSICKAFDISDPECAWGALFAFDALIGNTDRHPENWGFLERRNEKAELAPSFDHGTSLAYQILDENLVRESADEKIARHLGRGRHHARWAAGPNPEQRHFEMCRLFAETYPRAAPKMKRILDFSMDSVDEVLGRFRGFDLPVGILIDERRGYLRRLVAARQIALRAALGA